MGNGNEWITREVKWLMGILSALLVAVIIGHLGWISMAAQLSYQHEKKIPEVCEKVTNLEEWKGKHETFEAVQYYYIKGMAERMDIPPPPEGLPRDLEP